MFLFFETILNIVDIGHFFFDSSASIFPNSINYLNININVFHFPLICLLWLLEFNAKIMQHLIKIATFLLHSYSSYSVILKSALPLYNTEK